MKHIAVLLLALISVTVQTSAQDVIINPDISYAGTPRQVEIG